MSVAAIPQTYIGIDAKGRPYVVGTRIRVSYIVIDRYHHSMPAEEIADNYPNILTPAMVFAALAYYFDNREVVDKEIADEKALSESMLKEQNTSPLFLRLRGAGLI